MKHSFRVMPCSTKDARAVNGLSLAEGSTGNWPDAYYATPCSGASRFVCRGRMRSHRLAGGCASLTPKREPPWSGCRGILRDEEFCAR